MSVPTRREANLGGMPVGCEVFHHLITNGALLFFHQKPSVRGQGATMQAAADSQAASDEVDRQSHEFLGPFAGQTTH